MANIDRKAIIAETHRLKQYHGIRRYYIEQDIDALEGEAAELSAEDKTALAGQILEELDRNEDYLEIYWSIVRTVARSYLKGKRLGL